MACARAGDTVVVPWIDHLGRSLPEVAQAVTEFRGRGLRFRSMNDRLDTSSSPDVFDIFATLHAFERRRHGRPGADPARIAGAMRLVDDGLSVTKAAKQAGIGPANELCRDRRTATSRMSAARAVNHVLCDEGISFPAPSTAPVRSCGYAGKPGGTEMCTDEDCP